MRFNLFAGKVVGHFQNLLRGNHRNSGRGVRRLLEIPKGGLVEALVQPVLVSVPEVVRGSPGITICEHIKVPEAVSAANQFCEHLTSAGIIKIVPLPDSCHFQMIFDQEQNFFPGLFNDLQPIEDRFSQPDPDFGMIFNGFPFADIVQQQHEIEQAWQLGLLKSFAIFTGYFRFFTGENVVQFTDGFQHVLIS